MKDNTINVEIVNQLQNVEVKSPELEHAEHKLLLQAKFIVEMAAKVRSGGIISTALRNEYML